MRLRSSVAAVVEKRISAAAGIVRRERVEEARLRIVVIMVNWWKMEIGIDKP